MINRGNKRPGLLEWSESARTWAPSTNTEVMAWVRFLHYWTFVRVIHRWLVDYNVLNSRTTPRMEYRSNIALIAHRICYQCGTTDLMVIDRWSVIGHVLWCPTTMAVNGACRPSGHHLELLSWYFLIIVKLLQFIRTSGRLRWYNLTPPHDPLQWRHNVRDDVSNYHPHNCLLKRLFKHRSMKTKLRVTELCAGNSPVTGEFPAQMASNAENVSIWWRHYELSKICTKFTRG